MILSIPIAIILFLLDAITQAYIIERKRIWINHFLSASIAVVYCLTLSYFFNSGFKILTATAVLLALRFIFFDLFLNIWRGKDWNYVGEPDKLDAKSDSLLLKLPNPQYSQFIIKFSLLIITLIIHYYADIH